MCEVLFISNNAAGWDRTGKTSDDRGQLVVCIYYQFLIPQLGLRMYVKMASRSRLLILKVVSRCDIYLYRKWNKRYYRVGMTFHPFIWLSVDDFGIKQVAEESYLSFFGVRNNKTCRYIAHSCRIIGEPTSMLLNFFGDQSCSAHYTRPNIQSRNRKFIVVATLSSPSHIRTKLDNRYYYFHFHKPFIDK